MENTNNETYWKKIKELKKNQELVFIHTPKCGGTFASSILEKLNIRNKGHKLAILGEGITFTIIRNPIDRYESLLNYRLGYAKAKKDWPIPVKYIWANRTKSLNEIVKIMPDNHILSFRPYRSLCYWSENIDIFITIDKLEEFLSVFGYNININEFEKKNISNKTRGKFNEETRERIANLYSDDMELFNRVIL